MGKREQAGKSHSCPSHSRPCFTGRKEEGGEKETKTDISTEKKTTFFDKWKKIHGNTNTGN